MKERVEWIDCKYFPIRIIAIRLAKKKAFIHVSTGSASFVITTTRESAKRLMKS